MSRILALDYGTKRTGIAVSDSLQIIASGLKTVETSNLLDFLSNYIVEENIGIIIVGQPRRMDNSFSDIEQEILLFIKKLEITHPNIEIKRVDERFTSKLAFQSMIDSGMNKKKRQNKALVDEISATIILQSYLYHK